MRGRGKGRRGWRSKKQRRVPLPLTLPPPAAITSYTACCFCKKGEDPELGTFFQNIDADLAAHQFCLLFSCGLPQAGSDQDGFEGFLFPDIFKEVRRVRKIVCRFCLEYGASSGCFVRSCPFTYHYKCGLENDAQFDFHGTFNTHCYAHRSFQDTSYLLNGSNIPTCPICLDDVDGNNLSIIKMPCCINVFAHKECIQNQAKASGYFFRCPTCKNEKQFKREMARFGIYIPQRDASWEENNAFSDLLQQYQSCDLPKCKCPMGQNFEEEHGKWELIRCYHCGQGAVHRHCLGKRYISVYGYVCRDCDQVTGLLKGFTFSPRKSKEQTLEQKRLIQEGIAKGDPLVSQILLTPRTIAKRFNVKPCHVEITRLPDSFLLQLQQNEDVSLDDSDGDERLQGIYGDVCTNVDRISETFTRRTIPPKHATENDNLCLSGSEGQLTLSANSVSPGNSTISVSSDKKIAKPGKSARVGRSKAAKPFRCRNLNHWTIRLDKNTSGDNVHLSGNLNVEDTTIVSLNEENVAERKVDNEKFRQSSSVTCSIKGDGRNAMQNAEVNAAIIGEETSNVLSENDRHSMLYNCIDQRNMIPNDHDEDSFPVTESVSNVKLSPESITQIISVDHTISHERKNTSLSIGEDKEPGIVDYHEDEDCSTNITILSDSSGNETYFTACNSPNNEDRSIEKNGEGIVDISDGLSIEQIILASKNENRTSEYTSLSYGTNEKCLNVSSPCSDVLSGLVDSIESNLRSYSFHTPDPGDVLDEKLNGENVPITEGLSDTNLDDSKSKTNVQRVSLGKRSKSKKKKSPKSKDVLKSRQTMVLRSGDDESIPLINFCTSVDSNLESPIQSIDDDRPKRSGMLKTFSRSDEENVKLVKSNVTDSTELPDKSVSYQSSSETNMQTFDHFRRQNIVVESGDDDESFPLSTFCRQRKSRKSKDVSLSDKENVKPVISNETVSPELPDKNGLHLSSSETNHQTLGHFQIQDTVVGIEDDDESLPLITFCRPVNNDLKSPIQYIGNDRRRHCEMFDKDKNDEAFADSNLKVDDVRINIDEAKLATTPNIRTISDGKVSIGSRIDASVEEVECQAISGTPGETIDSCPAFTEAQLPIKSTEANSVGDSMHSDIYGGNRNGLSLKSKVEIPEETGCTNAGSNSELEASDMSASVVFSPGEDRQDRKPVFLSDVIKNIKTEDEEYVDVSYQDNRTPTSISQNLSKSLRRSGRLSRRNAVCNLTYRMSTRQSMQNQMAKLDEYHHANMVKIKIEPSEPITSTPHVRDKKRKINIRRQPKKEFCDIVGEENLVVNKKDIESIGSPNEFVVRDGNTSNTSANTTSSSVVLSINDNESIIVEHEAVIEIVAETKASSKARVRKRAENPVKGRRVAKTVTNDLKEQNTIASLQPVRGKQCDISSDGSKISGCNNYVKYQNVKRNIEDEHIRNEIGEPKLDIRRKTRQCKRNTCKLKEHTSFDKIDRIVLCDCAENCFGKCENNANKISENIANSQDRTELLSSADILKQVQHDSNHNKNNNKDDNDNIKFDPRSKITYYVTNCTENNNFHCSNSNNSNNTKRKRKKVNDVDSRNSSIDMWLQKAHGTVDKKFDDDDNFKDSSVKIGRIIASKTHRNKSSKDDDDDDFKETSVKIRRIVAAKTHRNKSSKDTDISLIRSDVYNHSHTASKSVSKQTDSKKTMIVVLPQCKRKSKII